MYEDLSRKVFEAHYQLLDTHQNQGIVFAEEFIFVYYAELSETNMHSYQLLTTIFESMIGI